MSESFEHYSYQAENLGDAIESGRTRREKEIDLSTYEEDLKDNSKRFHDAEVAVAILKTGSLPEKDIVEKTGLLKNRYETLKNVVGRIRETSLLMEEKSLKMAEEFLRDCGDSAPEKYRLRMEIMRDKSTLRIKAFRAKEGEYEVLRIFFEENN